MPAGMLALAISTVLAASPTVPAAPKSASELRAKVAFLTNETAYIDVGRLEGLGEGDTLEVRRDSTPIAKLRVNYLASHRATCIILDGAQPLTLGDEVRFVAHNAASPPAPAGPQALATTSEPSAKRSARTAQRRWLRGRIGGRYLGVRNADGTHFEQPMFELRADGTGSGPIDVALDLRGRRTSQSFSNGTERQESYSRVYRASVTWHDPKAHQLLTMGRQNSGALGPVSLFDGALLQTGGNLWSLGAFAGTQPEPTHMRLSGDIREFGVFAERRQAPLATHRWSIGIGAVSSYDHAAPDRDFVYLQSSYRDPRISGYLTQEVDFNRAWKRSRGESSVALTSTFANARASLTPWWELNTGYDNRRSVRLWRDRETPETIFDDSYRQGAWLGSNWSIARRLRLSGEVRSNGTGLDQADSWSVSADVQRIGMRGLALRSRYSRYGSDLQESRLFSMGVSIDPVSAVHLSWIGGERSLSQAISTSEATTRWQEFSVDYTFLRKWYANASYERDRGDQENLSQIQAGLSRRF